MMRGSMVLRRLAGAGAIFALAACFLSPSSSKGVSGGTQAPAPGIVTTRPGYVLSSSDPTLQAFFQSHQSCQQTGGLCQPTPLTVMTPVEIQQLAMALQYDPDLIYEYIHDNVVTLPQFGSLKGPLGTLLDGSGTVFDQAELTYALLNEATAHNSKVSQPTLQFGTVTLSWAQLTNWLGTANNLNAVLDEMQGAGMFVTDASAPQSAGASVNLPWVWVTASVNSQSVSYDPALKNYTLITGMSKTGGTTLAGALQYDRTQFLTASSDFPDSPNSSGISQISTSAPNRDGLRGKLTTYAQNLATYLKNQGTSGNLLTTNDVVGGKVIAPPPHVSTPLHPATLPNHAPNLTIGGTTYSTRNVIPGEFRSQLFVTLPGAPSTLLFNSSDIYGHKLTLFFNQSGSSYTPTLYLDGKGVATGSAGALGVLVPVGIAVSHPYPYVTPYSAANYANNSVSCTPQSQNGSANFCTSFTSTWNTGWQPQSGQAVTFSDTASSLFDQRYFLNLKPGRYSLVDGWGPTGRAMVEKFRTQEMQNILAENLFQGSTDESVLGSSLAMMGYTWLGQTAEANKLIDGITGTSVLRHHVIGVVGMVGSSSSGGLKGPYFDLPLIGQGLADRNRPDSTPLAVATPTLYGAAASSALLDNAFEAGVIQQIQWNPQSFDNPAAISAVSMIDTIMTSGLCGINDLNTGYSPSSGYSAASLSSDFPASFNTGGSDIAAVAFNNPSDLNYVTYYTNQGSRVITPQCYYYSGGAAGSRWSGTGYITIDPTKLTFGMWLATAPDGQPGSGLPASMGGGYADEDISPANLNKNVSLNFRPNGFSTSNTIAAGSRGNTSRALGAVADPVNLVTGDFLHSATDLTIGSGNFPYSLSFQRSYDSGSDTVLGPLGLGWTHNFAITAQPSSDGYEALGVNSPINAASAIATIYATQDIIANGGLTLSHVLEGAFAANWLMDKIIGNVMTVTYPGNSENFGALPDGSGYTPPPGSVSTLVSTLTSCPVYTTKDQQVLSFSCGGPIGTWQFPSGPKVTFTYDGNGSLASVDNGDLGRKLFFASAQSNSVANFYMITSVSDGSGANGTGANARTVTYNYATDANTPMGNNLLTVTGVAGAFTKYAYNPLPNSTVTSGQMGQIIYPQVDQTNPTQLGPPYTTIYYDLLNKVAVQTDGVGNQHYLYFAGTRTEMHDVYDVAGGAEYDTVYYFDQRGKTTLTTNRDTAQPNQTLLTTNTYDAWERPVSSVSPGGITVTNTYDAYSNLAIQVTTGTDGNTLKWSYTYEQPFNKVVKSIDPKGNASSNPDSYATQYVYDDQSAKPTGNLMSVISPAVNGSRPTQRYTYDAYGRIATSTDSAGEKTLYTYGGAPNVLQNVVDDSAHLKLTSIYNSYTPYGDPTSVTDPDNHVTTIAYDSARRKTGVSIWVTPTGGGHSSPVVTGYTYDLNGNLMNTDRGDGTVHFISSATHDNAFNVLTANDPSEPVTQYVYDGMNRVSQVADPNGHITTYTYNFRNQQLKVSNQASSSSSAVTLQTNTYNLDGVLQTVADGDSRTITYNLDGFDRVQNVVYPDGSTEKYTLDNNGNMLGKAVTGKSTASAGQQTASFSYTYDALNRVTSKSPQGQPTVNYTYDLAGRPASVYFANGSGTLTYTYDTAGRLKASTSQIGTDMVRTLGYMWDNNGNRTQLTWPDNTSVTYDYDELNRLQHIKESGVPLATFTYDSLSHRTNLALGDGSSASYSYDPAKADLTQISHQFTGSSFSFSYDSTATHQRRYSDVTDTNLVWPHPALGTTTYSPQFSATNYDQITGVTTTLHASGSNPTSMSIGYDGRGNVTCTGTISVLQPCVGNSYTFDSENHLMTAVSSGSNASYAYDPLGRRQSKNINGKVTQFVDDGLNEIAEYDGSGSLSAKTVFGPGSNEPLVIISGSDNSHTYLHSDAQGSVVALSVAGARTVSVAYGPFGESAALTGVSFGYTGHRYDAETGLYYTRARTYSPTIGRFLQRDPVGLSGGINPYAYTGNDPINNTDPSGMQADIDPTDVRYNIILKNEDGTTGGSWDKQKIDYTYADGSIQTVYNWVYYGSDSATSVGFQLSQAGLVRDYYSNAVSALDPLDSAGRTAVKSFARRITPPLVSNVLSVVRPGLGPNPGSLASANVSSTFYNNLGGAFKYGGGALFAAGVGYDIYETVVSPDPWRTGTEAAFGLVGSVGGGFAGAIGGGVAGTFVAPGPGTIGGTIAGTLVGGAAGGYGGRMLGGYIYDSISGRH